ncbi:MAG: hypothetical protein WA886_21465, partial [Candidatus Acidiferrales bacterium]
DAEGAEKTDSPDCWRLTEKPIPRCAPFLRQGKRDDTRFVFSAHCTDRLRLLPKRRWRTKVRRYRDLFA